jgi:hypothetical protein
MKKLLIVSALLVLALAGPASADSISVSLGSGQDIKIWTSPTAIDNAPWAGSLVLTVNNGPEAGMMLLGYCVDLYHWAGWNEEVTITTTDVLPTAGVPANVDPEAGYRAAYLYARNQLDKTLSAVESAALQVAIWEVLYDTASPNLTSGQFRLTSGGLVQTIAQGYLDDLMANNGKATALFFLAVDGKQSFITMVPEPASLFLFGSGLLSLGVMAKRRRAKK